MAVVDTGLSLNASVGLGNFNLVQREDGYQVDRIILTTDTSFRVSGSGPVESPRVSEPEPAEPTRFYFEAEDAENLSADDFAPFAIQSDSGASGGQYLVWPGSGGQNLTAEDSDTGKARYTLNLPDATQRLQFWAKVRFPSAADNSVHYRLEGNGFDSGWNSWNSATSGDWAWFNVDRFESLAAGQYNLTLLIREDGAAVRPDLFQSHRHGS